MKIFSIIAILLGIIMSIFSVISKDYLALISTSFFISTFFCFFYFQKDKTKKYLMTLATAFLPVYAVLSFVKTFTEKGHF